MELQTTELPCGLRIRRNDENRVVIIGDNLAVFTPTEYRLLTVLLDGDITTDATLVAEVFHCGEMDKAMRNLLKKHIENVKGKLKTVSLDLYRVYRTGYVLMPVTDKCVV